MTEIDITSYIKAIDSKNIDEVKELLKENNIFKDIGLEIYNKGLLTPERLQFIIKNEYNCFRV
jgi:hypothetical protein